MQAATGEGPCAVAPERLVRGFLACDARGDVFRDRLAAFASGVGGQAFEPFRMWAAQCIREGSSCGIVETPPQQSRVEAQTDWS